MSVDRAPAQAAYDAAAETIGAHLRAGQDVAYLCEGDPLFYGSAMYLLSRLAAVVPVRVIPGVTSLTAAAAAIARPLAARNEVLKVLPAPLPDAVLRAELADAELCRDHQGRPSLRPHPRAARRDRPLAGRGGGRARDHGEAAHHAARRLRRTTSARISRPSSAIAAARPGHDPRGHPFHGRRAPSLRRGSPRSSAAAFSAGRQGRAPRACSRRAPRSSASAPPAS